MLNKVMIIGNLGKEPQLKHLPSGSAVCKLVVATSEKWKDKTTQQPVEKTEWHNVTLFGKQAEIADKYLSKGKKVYIEGRLQTREWEKDGVKRYATDIIANAIQFLSPKSEQSNQTTETGFSSDEIPF